MGSKKKHNSQNSRSDKSPKSQNSSNEQQKNGGKQNKKSPSPSPSQTKHKEKAKPQKSSSSRKWVLIFVISSLVAGGAILYSSPAVHRAIDHIMIKYFHPDILVAVHNFMEATKNIIPPTTNDDADVDVEDEKSEYDKTRTEDPGQRDEGKQEDKSLKHDAKQKHEEKKPVPKQEERAKPKQEEKAKSKQEDKVKPKREETAKQEEKPKLKQEEKAKPKQEEKVELKQEAKPKQEERPQQKQEETAKPKQEEKSKAKQEEKLKPKQEEKAKPKHEEKVVPKHEEKAKPKQDEKAKPKQEEKSKPKQEEKAVPKQEEKSKPKQEEKSKPKQEEKAVPKQEEKTKPKQEEKSKPKQEEKAVPKQEEKTKPKQEEKSKPKQEEKTMPKQEEKSKPKQEEKTKPKQEDKPQTKEADKKPVEKTQPKREEKVPPKQEEKTHSKQEEKTKQEDKPELKREEKPVKDKPEGKEKEKVIEKRKQEEPAQKEKKQTPDQKQAERTETDKTRRESRETPRKEKTQTSAEKAADSQMKQEQKKKKKKAKEEDGDDEAAKKEKYAKSNITNKADNLIRSALDEADSLYEKKKHQDALEKFDTILTKHPRSPRALYGKALVLNRLAEQYRSNEILERCIALLSEVLQQPDVPDDLYKEAGRTLSERQEFRGWGGKAVKTHIQLVTRFPADVKLKNELGVRYLMIGKNDEAQNVFENVLKINPADGFAMVHLGFIMKTYRDDLDKGIKLLADGIATREPGTLDGRFFFHLGDALQRLNRTEEAYQYYREGERLKLFLSQYQRSLHNVDFLTGRPWWSEDQTGYSKYFKLLEDNWKVIRDEGLAQLDPKSGMFMPEEEKLSEKGSWKQFTLYAQGRKDKRACEKAPKTCAIIDQIPDARSCTRGQTKFSVMKPGVHVWPHCGPTNCRIRAHLGLVIPPGPKIRVVSDTREWKEGKIIVFDDSFEHEVWHNGNETRLVLIVDFWHPELTAYLKRTLAPI